MENEELLGLDARKSIKYEKIKNDLLITYTIPNVSIEPVLEYICESISEYNSDLNNYRNAEQRDQLKTERALELFDDLRQYIKVDQKEIKKLNIPAEWCAFSIEFTYNNTNYIATTDVAVKGKIEKIISHIDQVTKTLYFKNIDREESIKYTELLQEAVIEF